MTVLADPLVRDRHALLLCFSDSRAENRDSTKVLHTRR